MARLGGSEPVPAVAMADVGGSPASYWEARARRFAGRGAGLAAVCSYGMPAFYNRAIEWTQRLALRRWLAVPPGAAVLDAGCGIGRWSRRLAARGAEVTGVDLSATMVAEAERRTAAAGLAERCRFLVQDLAELDAGGPFDLVLGVTVLQHVLDRERLLRALGRLGAALAPSGRAVLLEAAPTRPFSRCDGPAFAARDAGLYEALFTAAGLDLEAVCGVDPMPLKTLLLPYYARLPRPVALTALLAVTALSLPVDAAVGRRWVGPSWHKVFVLRRARGGPDGR